MAQKLKNITKNKLGFKIGIYVRVSTEEQAQNLEGSIKNQEQRIRSHIEYKNKIIVPKKVPHIGSSQGLSSIKGILCMIM